MHITIPEPGKTSDLFHRGVRLARQLLRERPDGHFTAMDFRHTLALPREEGDLLLTELQQQGVITRIPGMSVATYKAPHAG